MIRLNSSLIENPNKALEVMMAVTAALYTGIDKGTPMVEATKVAETCAAMWQVCDALKGLTGGVAQ